MPAKKRKAKKKSAPAKVVGLAQRMGEELIAATQAWTEIRRIADDELARISGRD